MPTFSNQVPKDPRGVALPIRRTPPHTPLVAVVTSDDLVGCMTHYYKARTMPHEETNCEACDAGMPRRWHAYMSAWDPKVAMHFLFEITAQAAVHFTTYRQAHGTLRGCHFRATRWRQSPNGRVLIECKPADIVSHPIPKGPDLIKVLSILWNLPSTALHDGQFDPEEKTRIVGADHVEKQTADPRNRIGSQNGRDGVKAMKLE